MEPRAEATWLVTIAQNVCLNRGRDARRMRAHEHPREPEELERLAGADAPEPVDLEELKLAVQELPEQQRRAILLREWQGCTYAEIEQELGLGKAHVETLIFRGRRALAQRLEGRLRSLDAASLLSFCKTGFGGVGAAKLAGCAAAVAVCVGSGIAIERLVRTPEAPSRPPSSSVPVPEVERPVQAPGTAPARATVAPEPRTRAATASSAAAPAASRAGRGADRVAPTGAPAPVADAPAAAPAGEASAPSVPAAEARPRQAPAPAAAPAAPTVDGAAAAAGTAAEGVAGAVEDTAEGALDTVTGAVGTVTGAVGTVTGTVTGTVGTVAGSVGDAAAPVAGPVSGATAGVTEAVAPSAPAPVTSPGVTATGLP